LQHKNINHYQFLLIVIDMHLNWLTYNAGSFSKQH
jgi:hypothetical protein